MKDYWAIGNGIAGCIAIAGLALTNDWSPFQVMMLVLGITTLSTSMARRSVRSMVGAEYHDGAAGDAHK